MKQQIAWLIAVSFLTLAGLTAGCSQDAPPHDAATTPAVGVSAAELLSGELIDGVRVIPVKAFQFGFTPERIVVRKGETVRLLATSTDVDHGIAIREYDINVPMPANEEQTIEFVAGQAGEFRVHCSVYCGAGHGAMHATLVVLE